MHAVALVVLSLLFLPGERKRAPIALDFGTTDAATSSDFAAVDLALAEPVAAEDAAADAPDATLVAPPLPTIDAAFAPEEPAVAPSLLEASPLETVAAGGFAAVALTAVPEPAMADSIGGDGLLAGVAGDRGESSGRGGTAAAGREAATFFGRSGEGKRVCFLCDNSSSYRDGGFHMVLEELARAIDGLRPDQSFFVVFFSDTAYPLFHPAPANALAPATADNKRRLRAWLQSVEMCRGGQGIHEAVTLVGSLHPDVVYLLSDGQMTGSVVDRVSDADFGEAVVHTFGMQQSIVDRRTGRIDADRAREQDGCNRNLATIAAAHGGGFTPVIVPPPAAVLERLRPIARNRTRGTVWGLRL